MVTLTWWKPVLHSSDLIFHEYIAISGCTASWAKNRLANVTSLFVTTEIPNLRPFHTEGAQRPELVKTEGQEPLRVYPTFHPRMKFQRKSRQSFGRFQSKLSGRHLVRHCVFREGGCSCWAFMHAA